MTTTSCKGGFPVELLGEVHMAVPGSMWAAALLQRE